MSHWIRYVRVDVGAPGKQGLSWATPLHITFDVSKTSRGHDPDAATIRIYNLASDERDGLAAGSYVRLFVGYGGREDAALLYEGEITDVESVRQGVDRVTTIEAGDGASALLTGAGHMAVSIDAGNPVEMAINAVSSQLGIPVEVIEGLPVVSAVQGMCFDDTADRILDSLVGELARGTGDTYEWSIRGGVLLIGPAGATSGQAPLITPDTGLIGSPRPVEDGIEFRALLNPLILPRGAVSLRSRDYSGVYKVTSVRHRGDSFGGDFYSDVQAEFVAKVAT